MTNNVTRLVSPPMHPGWGLGLLRGKRGNVVRARELLENVPRGGGRRKPAWFRVVYLSRLCHLDELTLAGHSRRVRGAWRSARTAGAWRREAMTRR